jgi:hypothetical protein
VSSSGAGRIRRHEVGAGSSAASLQRMVLVDETPITSSRGFTGTVLGTQAGASPVVAVRMAAWCPSPRRLTVKLSGRTESPDRAEGAQFLGARGAKPQAHHGPLQRLLDASHCSADLNSGDGVITSTPIKRPKLSISR